MLRHKQEIDVEDLVRWTYLDQKAERIIDHGVGLYEAEAAVARIETGSGCVDSCAKTERMLSLGCFIDGGGMSSDALHPDAEAVATTVTGMMGAGLPVRRGRGVSISTASCL